MVEISIGKSLNKNIPKEALFRNLDITPTIRKKLISDIKKISLVHTISPLTCNLKTGETVKEINVINIELKKKEIDIKILEKIAKQTPFKIVFQLIYDGEKQVVIYHDMLFKTTWSNRKFILLDVQGLTLNDLWKQLVSQVGEFEIRVEQGLDETIEKNVEIERIKRQIKILENKIQNERQFNKQLELRGELRRLCMELEVIMQ